MRAHIVKSARIQASREVIWSVLADVKRWPEWIPFYQKAIVSPGFRDGAEGKVRHSNGQVLTFTIEYVIPLREFSIRYDLPLGCNLHLIRRINSANDSHKVVFSARVDGFMSPFIRLRRGPEIDEEQVVALRGLEAAATHAQSIVSQTTLSA